jgi:hypothetical protein
MLLPHPAWSGSDWGYPIRAICRYRLPSHATRRCASPNGPGVRARTTKPTTRTAANTPTAETVNRARS